jgi:SAM-dependent methyltransferase
MPSTPEQLFGAVARNYASHRLTYPPAFFAAFAERCGGLELVWDCGCGNGQASLALAGHFAQVIATDASAAQLEAAFQHPRVSYRCAPAEASGLEDSSVDGVLVAAAVHWFAGEGFNSEVQRVARPGAAMAWIGYLPLQLEEAHLQSVVDRFYSVDLAAWWPPQRRWVDQSYAGLAFPGKEWPFPADLWIERHWTLSALLGYLGTWSAVQAARETGVDPLATLAAELAPLWPGGDAAKVLVRWPFMGRWGLVGT